MKNKHILNISAIKVRMKRQPQGQRLHLFFTGIPDLLDREQMQEIREIVVSENKKMVSFLNANIKKSRKKTDAA